MACSPPVSSVHGISQARILEWIAVSFSRESSWPRDQTHVFCTLKGFFTTEPPGEALILMLWSLYAYTFSVNEFMNKSKFIHLHFANGKSEAFYVAYGNLYSTEQEQDWEELGHRFKSIYWHFKNIFIFCQIHATCHELTNIMTCHAWQCYINCHSWQLI